MIPHESTVGRFVYEKIEPSGTSGVRSHRVMDTTGDDRVATCYLEENARLVVDLMNRGLSQPALLAALKRLTAVCRHLPADPEFPVNATIHALAQADLAIAKAEKGGGS